jgi:hypothetical protein
MTPIRMKVKNTRENHPHESGRPSAGSGDDSAILGRKVNSQIYFRFPVVKMIRIVTY